MLFLPPSQEHFVMNDDFFFSSSSNQQGDFVGLVDAGREAGQRKTFGLGDILAEI